MTTPRTPILTVPRAQALLDGRLLDVKKLALASPALSRALRPYAVPVAITLAAMQFVERNAAGQVPLAALAEHLELTAVLLANVAQGVTTCIVYADEHDLLRLASTADETGATVFTLLLESEE